MGALVGASAPWPTSSLHPWSASTAPPLGLLALKRAPPGWPAAGLPAVGGGMWLPLIKFILSSKFYFFK
jgi:hypothetical protein